MVAYVASWEGGNSTALKGVTDAILAFGTTHSGAVSSCVLREPDRRRRPGGHGQAAATPDSFTLVETITAPAPSNKALAAFATLSMDMLINQAQATSANDDAPNGDDYIIDVVPLLLKEIAQAARAAAPTRRRRRRRLGEQAQLPHHTLGE